MSGKYDIDYLKQHYPELVVVAAFYCDHRPVVINAHTVLNLESEQYADNDGHVEALLGSVKDEVLSELNGRAAKGLGAFKFNPGFRYNLKSCL